VNNFQQLSLDSGSRPEMLYSMQTTHQVEIVASSVPDWQTSEEDAIIPRPGKSKRRKKPAGHAKLPPSADRPLGFAQAVRQRADCALIRCEERYPQEGPQSVLYVVVEGDAAQWSERLNALHHDYFGPGQSDPQMPVQLVVIDRATHDAVQRLIAAGLIALTARATRALWPVDESTTSPPPLSEAEREKAAAHRAQAARKLRVAGVLAGGDLAEEARLALLDAIEPLGHALAVENRLPEPQSLEDALLPPLGPAWKEALPLVRNFLRDPAQPVRPVLNALTQV
jgi:hypothetical protein